MSFPVRTQPCDQCDEIYVNTRRLNTNIDGGRRVVVDQSTSCPQCMQEAQQPMQQSRPSTSWMSVSEIVNNEREFCVAMNVRHFKPEEINIRIRDNHLLINARHEERPDVHGYIMREFTRQYALPADVDPDTVTSALSVDGVLTLKAPKRGSRQSEDRSIPIERE